MDRVPVLIPPPAIYRCESEDRKEFYSEYFDPKPHCEPYLLYYPDPNVTGPPTACRWVTDRCTRLSDKAACAYWKQKRKQATADVANAFSDTVAFRKAELERAIEVTQRSCP